MVARGYGGVRDVEFGGAGSDRGVDRSSNQAIPAAGQPINTSPLTQSFHQGGMSAVDAPDERGFTTTNPSLSRNPSQSRNRNQLSNNQDEDGADLQRTLSYGSSKSGTAVGGAGVSRSNTLKKSKSLSRKTSLKRGGSRKSLAAGSIKTMTGAMGGDKEYNSVFHTPIPTSGTPTEILANRFQCEFIILPQGWVRGLLMVE